MKIITRAVLDWDGNILEEESYEYSGPVAECKDSGSAPTPTDPYQQAGAQYGLATGTAAYNAALDRTNSSNPLGSNTWNVTGYSDAGTGSPSSGSYGPYSIPSSLGGGLYGFGGTDTSSESLPNGSGAPIYSQSTSLSPWANSLEESPINTAGIPGLDSNASVEQNDAATANAEFNSQMGYLAPQEALQSEQTQAQLEAEGAMPGSAAYNTGQQQLSQQQTFENTQAADQAVAAGNQEEATLYGLGGEQLQNEESLRMAPISEYEALAGNPSTAVSAETPDISGAFNQQYQGQLAGYNANTATNNANTSALGTAAVAALMYY
jgi:hypothetical protein